MYNTIIILIDSIDLIALLFTHDSLSSNDKHIDQVQQGC